jgi:osmoprotectant transport system permease protein
LALVVDQFLGVIEKGMALREPRRIYLGLTGLAAGTALALTPLIGGKPNAYRVGAKNFSEQFILAELISQQLNAAGATAERRENLGSAIAFRALASGDIDVYVDYCGTLWTNVMARADVPAREIMLRELTRWMRDRYGVLVLGSLGFENAYTLAMRRDRATALRVSTIGDLAAHAPQLTLGADLEFLSRPEWATLKNSYALDFKALRSFSPTFMYRAIQDGSVDVISAFSSDGRIDAQDLMVLADPKHAIPSYDAVVLIAPKRSKDPTLIGAITPLLGKISVEHMREANLMVDRDTDKASPREAAGFLARAIGLPDVRAPSKSGGRDYKDDSDRLAGPLEGLHGKIALRVGPDF